jgi:hypothetical protein
MYTVCANVGLKKGGGGECNLTAQNEQYNGPYLTHFPFREVDGMLHRRQKWGWCRHGKCVNGCSCVIKT